MAELVTSVRVGPARGEHVEVTIWVNHANAGTLVMRTKEAEEFVARLVHAEKVSLEAETDV